MRFSVFQVRFRCVSAFFQGFCLFFLCFPWQDGSGLPEGVARMPRGRARSRAVCRTFGGGSLGGTGPLHWKGRGGWHPDPRADLDFGSTLVGGSTFEQGVLEFVVSLKMPVFGRSWTRVCKTALHAKNLLFGSRWVEKEEEEP